MINDLEKATGQRGLVLFCNRGARISACLNQESPFFIRIKL